MKKLILLLLCIGLLSACNKEIIKHSYLFTGEGEYWKAEVRYEAREEWGKNHNYDSESDYTFTLAYKGDLDELASVEQFYYEYKLASGFSSTSLTFDRPISSKSFTSTGSGAAILRDYHSVDVNVKWDDHEEAFQLVVD